MRIVSTLFAALLIASSGFAQKTPSADELAHRTVDLLGGGGALERARYFSYTFKVEKNNNEVGSFPQRWDRVTGDYHVSGRRPDGIPFEATINVNTRAVSGTIQGRTVSSPDDLKKLYQFAYERYIADTFWLLMPLKMVDPPFQREYDGPRNDSCGHTWDLLKLTVEVKPGNPPAGVYWPWISRGTGMVEEWDMKPAGLSADQPPIEVIFHDYRRVAGLLISLRREMRGLNQSVRFDDLVILSETPKGAFKR
jgi:hypothetical protein